VKCKGIKRMKDNKEKEIARGRRVDVFRNEGEKGVSDITRDCKGSAKKNREKRTGRRVEQWRGEGIGCARKDGRE